MTPGTTGEIRVLTPTKSRYGTKSVRSSISSGLARAGEAGIRAAPARSPTTSRQRRSGRMVGLPVSGQPGYGPRPPRRHPLFRGGAGVRSAGRERSLQNVIAAQLVVQEAPANLPAELLHPPQEAIRRRLQGEPFEALPRGAAQEGENVG